MIQKTWIRIRIHKSGPQYCIDEYRCSHGSWVPPSLYNYLQKRLMLYWENPRKCVPLGQSQQAYSYVNFWRGSLLRRLFLIFCVNKSRRRYRSMHKYPIGRFFPHGSQEGRGLEIKTKTDSGQWNSASCKLIEQKYANGRSEISSPLSLPARPLGWI